MKSRSPASLSPTPFLTVTMLLISAGLAACTATPAGSAAAPADQAATPPPASAASVDAAMPVSSHASTGASAQAAPQAAAAVTVQPNAPPAGGLSIAETWAKRASLAGTPVTVRGTVVKVNNSIMGSNWLHLQDGSGKAADGTNDLTVTTDAVVKVGDVVTVTGTLAVKKDFGSGYSYEAILEKATIK